VDVRDPDAVGWLLACVWADHEPRRRRLRAAIELARAAPPRVVRGDLVDDLPGLLAEAPRDARLVVFHSAVLSYVSGERRAAFADALAAASTDREIVWISNEAAGVVARFATEAAGAAVRLADEAAGTLARSSVRAGAAAARRFALGRTTFLRGRATDQLLALAHPHGAAMTWL
jgi:hypothetical protein